MMMQALLAQGTDQSLQQVQAAAQAMQLPNSQFGPPSQYHLGNQVFYGSVKSYSAEKGWGHIDCANTKAIYGKDMFVLKSLLSECPGIQAGDHVSFCVKEGEKGPEATNVRRASG